MKGGLHLDRLAEETAREKMAFPIKRRFRTPEEIREYFAGNTLVCLICGRSMARLSRHLGSAHDMSVDDYKQRYGLPWGRGLVSEALRQKLAEKLAAQAPRPIPNARNRRRKRPRQPFEQVLPHRALEHATPKRPNTRTAHESFLKRLRTGRTVRSVARDPDMPSLDAHYAYRRAHAHYDERVRRAIREVAHRPRKHLR